MQPLKTIALKCGHTITVHHEKKIELFSSDLYIFRSEYVCFQYSLDERSKYVCFQC